MFGILTGVSEISANYARDLLKNIFYLLPIL